MADAKGSSGQVDCGQEKNDEKHVENLKIIGKEWTRDNGKNVYVRYNSE